MFRRTRIAAMCLLTALVLPPWQAARADNKVVIILDDSGSMEQRMASGERRIEAAKQALKSVLEQLPPQTVVGVLALNSRLDGSPWIVPMDRVNATPWQQRVAQIKAAGGTPLGQFSKTAADELLRMRASDRYSTYRLLIITDGEATDRELLQSFLPSILARGLVLNVIGVDMAGDHSLASLAQTYRRADDVQSLITAISEVFAETASTDQDLQSDFELLSGLPEGFAEEVIQSMSQIHNQPIEPSSLAEPLGGGESRPGSAANASSPDSPGTIIGGLMCCCGSTLGLLIVAAILLRGLFGKRRR